MPVGIPSAGGPIGRSRMRISASGYVTWKRCPRQWFIGSKVGLRGPVNPRMVMGIRVEEALVGLLMESPMGNHLKGKSRWSAWISDTVETDGEPDGQANPDEAPAKSLTPASIDDLRESSAQRIGRKNPTAQRTITGTTLRMKCFVTCWSADFLFS